MFKKLSGKDREVDKETQLYAPLTSEYVEIEDMPDPVSVQKTMGGGFGISPTEGEAVSPVAGEVDNVFPTKHAIGLKTKNGPEILVHIGLDAVQLGGEGFSILTSGSDIVQVGDPLLKLDLEFTRNDAKSVISPITIINPDQTGSIPLGDVKAVIRGEIKAVNVTTS